MYNQGQNPYMQQDIVNMQENLLNFSPGGNAGNPQIFIYSGNPFSVSNKLSELSSEELQKIRSLRINISGNQVSEANVACMCATIILGSIFIFPLFFMCCSWWQRIVNVLFMIPPQTYGAISKILPVTASVDFYLNIQDNFFNQEKANILLEGIKNSSVKNFVFSNIAQPFDGQGSNFSDFSSYMKGIKNSLPSSDISWGPKICL